MGASAGRCRVTPAPIMLSDDLLAAPGLPSIVRSPLELDGYLTAVIVTPQSAPIRLHKWVAGLWREDEAIFDDIAVMKTVLDPVIGQYNAIAAEIDHCLGRLEAEKICDYRPLFLPGSDKLDQGSVRLWVRGFWKAMTLAPDTWTAMMTGDRGQKLLRPFVGFFEPDGHPTFETDGPDDLDEILDEDAAAIPHAILLLRKLARMRCAKQPEPVNHRRPAKVGRNDPCPCRSGRKYKHCCARH
jgi:uncharacterized protein